ncbi:MAG: hypothetical protein RPS47_06730 [Colwellia sp.]|jgi:hypothetical protein
MIKTKQLIGITALSLLAACGGGAGEANDGGTPSGKSPEKKVGVFLDSPIINIAYQTETLSGVTNSSGEFEYLSGETVTFSIGDLTFPATIAQSVVTPIDIANAQSASDATVLNMIRLLQTLDKDSNPDNGITITDAAKAAATQVDFTSTDFETSSAVNNLILSAGQDSTVLSLVSTQDALAHFESVLNENGLTKVQYYQVKLDLPDGYSAFNKVTLADSEITFEELYASSQDTLETNTASFSMASDGRLTVAGESTGAGSSNSAVMIGVDTNGTDGDVGLSIFTKIDSAATVNSLYGKFHCAALDSEPYSAFYEMTLYGNGDGNQTLIQDSDGESGTASFTYGVSQGVLSITGSNNSLKGGIANNGTVLTLVQYNSDSDSGITICVKASSGKSNGTISGDYYGGSLDSEPYTSFSTFNFSGTGTAVYSELSISGDDPDTNESFPYSVNSDGRLTIGSSTLGAVSPDGSVIVYAKTDLSGDLSLGILVKN